MLEASALSGVGVLLLQREVPEAVNLAAALAAADAGVPVMMVSGSVQLRGKAWQVMLVSVTAALSQRDTTHLLLMALRRPPNPQLQLLKSA